MSLPERQRVRKIGLRSSSRNTQMFKRKRNRLYYILVLQYTTSNSNTTSTAVIVILLVLQCWVVRVEDFLKAIWLQRLRLSSYWHNQEENILH